MKNAFRVLFVLVPLLLAGSVSGHTVTIVNLSGSVMGYNSYVNMYNMGLSLGTTKIDLTPEFLVWWNSHTGFFFDGLHDEQIVFFSYDQWVQSEVTPDSDSTIQSAFNQGLFWSAGVVAVLLSFSIIRTIPGGGHEEL